VNLGIVARRFTGLKGHREWGRKSFWMPPGRENQQKAVKPGEGKPQGSRRKKFTEDSCELFSTFFMAMIAAQNQSGLSHWGMGKVPAVS